jgi:hydroxyacyl-ACP dehydratase HTD2-like protein with hotdog domain
MAEESLITQEMRDAIGVEGPPVTLEVDKTSVRMFARAVGHTDLVFYDEEEAKRRGFRSLPAPPGYLGTPIYNPQTSDPTFGGPRRGLPQFKTNLKRRLNGGTEIEYFGDICAGDTLTSRARIVDIQERTGSIGKMLITTTETVYYNQNGQLVAKMRGTGIQY